MDLAQQIERQIGGIDGVHLTAFEGLRLYRHAWPPPASAVVYEPALCVIAQGAKRVIIGEQTHHYDAGRFLLVTADVPALVQVVDASPERPYLGLALRLEPLEVSELIAQLGAALPPCPATLALAVNPLAPELLCALERLLTLSPEDVPFLAPLIRREITYHLLKGPDGPRLRQMVAGGDQGQRITDALRWLKAHYAEPLRVESLARQAGMSPSGFHRHFKAVTALSPLQYQKQLRLQEARRLMLGEALDTSEACQRVGYESASQFSREYRRLFGAPPRRDIEGLRGAPAAG